MIKSEYKYKKGLIDGLSIGLGYLSVAFGFGISASAAGLMYFIGVNSIRI
jgi:predicted branched-subunit amino acid permease